MHSGPDVTTPAPTRDACRQIAPQYQSALLQRAAALSLFSMGAARRLTGATLLCLLLWLLVWWAQGP